MTGSRLVSRGTAYFAVISTLNLLIIMAAIANDGSVSNSSTTTSNPVTTKAPPRISSLVRGPSFETVIKVGGAKDRVVPTTPGSGKLSPVDNSTMSSFADLINSSSTSPFTTQNWTEIRAQYKSNALLPCHSKSSGDGVTVSWIRRHDYHLLTVGLQTYSSDDRFQAIHAQSPDDWTLKIKYVQPRDAGIYECQVSTHPPSSIFVTLSVVEARAEIIGGPEKIYKAGSTVELKCDFVDSTEEPEYVFWYQGLHMINYDRSRHINVTHYKSSSVLVLHNVQKTDTGNYSCVPSNAAPASIFVHIINGENPAAMQHGSHSTSCVPCPPLWFLSFILSLTIQALYFRFMSNHVDRYHDRTSSTAPVPDPAGRGGSIQTDTSPFLILNRRDCQCQQLHHNHQSHLSISPITFDTRVSETCHNILDRDGKRSHSNELSKLGKHYCGCKESEKGSSTVVPVLSFPNQTEEPNQGKSRTRLSLLSSDSSTAALRFRSMGRQGESFHPVTPHSKRLTVR